MSNLRTEEISKIYFSMGETARRLGVAQSAVRYYMGVFNLNVKRVQKDNRIFTENDILILQWIIKAADIYKLKFIVAAFHVLHISRFRKQELLDLTETEKIYEYLKSKTV